MLLVPNLNPSCATGPFVAPPNSPGGPALTLLGCVGRIGGAEMSLQCHVIPNPRGNANDAANIVGTLETCLSSPLPVKPTLPTITQSGIDPIAPNSSGLIENPSILIFAFMAIWLLSILR
jgi:hypothetical protein